MEAKFTKGQWMLNRAMNEIVSENDCTKNGGIDIIAQCFCGFDYDSTKPEAEANAKLIAAAPDLYNACVAMTGYCNKNNIEMLCPEYEMMCKALKKATE